MLWPIRMLRARAELNRLADLTDRELGDIGLKRQDLRDATSLPLDVDPTRFLASVATERRRARRRW
jgi:hypothetical protein